MNYWIIADTHFGHPNMQKYCDRPKDADEQIIKSFTGLNGVMIHLGDICFSNHDTWNLRFTAPTMLGGCDLFWLIKGNHDKKSNNWYLRHGWDFVGDVVYLQIYGKRIAFSHRPIIDDGTFDLNIHGHLHNTTRTCDYLTDKHILIKCEHTYRPVNLRKLVEGKHGKIDNTVPG